MLRLIQQLTSILLPVHFVNPWWFECLLILSYYFEGLKLGVGFATITYACRANNNNEKNDQILFTITSKFSKVPPGGPCGPIWTKFGPSVLKSSCDQPNTRNSPGFKSSCSTQYDKVEISAFNSYSAQDSGELPHLRTHLLSFLWLSINEPWKIDWFVICNKMFTMTIGSLIKQL